MTTKLSAKEAARELGTDARTLRKFIRSAKDLPIEPVGQGARYEFTTKEVKQLKKAFVAWSNGSTPKAKINNTKLTKKQTEDLEAVEQGEMDEMADAAEIDLEDLEGPSDDELMEIEDIELD